MRRDPGDGPAATSCRGATTTIDFTPPFAAQDVRRAVRRSTRASIADRRRGRRRKLAKTIGLETAGKHPDVIKSEVFEEKVEDALDRPDLRDRLPGEHLPADQAQGATIPPIAERFELFIQGMEVANAYTELNDPDLQEELFRTQLAGQAEEDSMAKMDHDFVRALRHGMPPAGGLGIGIDRLVMLLTNTQTIRDVILFPLLRPEANSWSTTSRRSR